MGEERVPGISVDEIMWQIQEEVSRQKERAALQSAFPDTPQEPLPSPVKLPRFVREERIVDKEAYHVNEFMVFHDEAFVKNAYRGILKREVDSEGLENYLPRLRSADLPKIMILGKLRFSREGKMKGVRVRGLAAPLLFGTLCRIPVAGYFLRLGSDILRIPAILKGIRELENFSLARAGLIAQQQDMLSDAIERQVGASISRLEFLIKNRAYASSVDFIRRRIEAKADADVLEELRNAISEKAEAAVVAEVEALRGSLAEKAERGLTEVRRELDRKADREAVDNVEGNLKEMFKQIRDHKRNILDEHQRLARLLEEVKARSQDSMPKEELESIVKEEDRLLDAMYVELEDRFRGTREDIKERQRVYIKYVRQAHEDTDGSSLLDVGCGRGEWLEVLKENGLPARGVDINRVMVHQCRERGLDIEERDAVDYLRDQRSTSLCAITGFHIVEHLLFRDLVALLDESLRVLKPGGLVIFETPNPENILVGSCNFYNDPTHIKPIPPATLHSLVEMRGFDQAQILRLSPLNFLNYDKQDELRHIIFRFNMEQDYAVIARKPEWT